MVLVDGGKVAGKPAHHLKVTRADLPTQHVYLDPETFVEMRVTTEGPTASETDLSDYKAVEGVMVPHNIKISQNGALVAELRIYKVEFNFLSTTRSFELSNAPARFAACRLQRLLACGQATCPRTGYWLEDSLLAGCAATGALRVLRLGLRTL